MYVCDDGANIVPPAETVVVSWYGPGFEGRPTASGETFNPGDMTAAHRTLPFGTVIELCYEGQCVRVRINDRGPHVKGRDIDLAQGAAEKLGIIEEGVVEAKMRVIGGDPQ